jgi:hypothetical protein
VIYFSLINPYSTGPFNNLPIKIYKGTYVLVQGTVKNPDFIAAPLICTMSPLTSIQSNSKYKQVDYILDVSTPYLPLIDSELQIIVPEYFERQISGYQQTLYYYSTN